MRHAHDQEKTHNSTVIYNETKCPARDCSGNPFPASERDKIAAESPTRLLSGDAAKKNYALRLANFSL